MTVATKHDNKLYYQNYLQELGVTLYTIKNKPFLKKMFLN